MGIKKSWDNFCKFMKKDTWASLAVTLLIAFLVIKFIFFPVLSFLTGTALPLVIVESCSMYHDEYGEEGLEKVLENSIYSDYYLDYVGVGDWNFRGGMNKGDVVFVVGRGSTEVGDIIIFDSNGGAAHPIIHRVIDIDSKTGEITTKGDGNPEIYSFDRNIQENQLVGKAIFKIPIVGWAKLIFFEASRDPRERGLC
jgi:hypothetical protein